MWLAAYHIVEIGEGSLIFIGLGSNQPGRAGRPIEMLAAAFAALEKRGVLLRAWSGLYRSEAYPDPADPKFLNMVIEVDTDLGPSLLLNTLHEVERHLGRQRRRRNEPRSIDLDLLDYRGLVMSKNGLELPHPRLQERAFVLAPLSQIRPNWRHPVSKQTAFMLLEGLGGRKIIERLG